MCTRRFRVAAFTFFCFTVAFLPMPLSALRNPRGGFRTIDGAASTAQLPRRVQDVTDTVSISDPVGDTKLTLLFDQPGTHTQVSGATLTVVLPSWLINDLQGFGWEAYEYEHEDTTPVGTFIAPGPSQVTSPSNLNIPDWADIVSASIQQVDPQRLSFSLTTRGPIPSTDSLSGGPTYAFFIGPDIEIDIDYFPGEGWQAAVFAPSFNRHRPAAFEDFTSATGQNRNGVLHFTLTTAAAIPAIPDPNDGDPYFFWILAGAQRGTDLLNSQRIFLRFDRQQAKWVLEVWLNTGHFFSEQKLASGTFSMNGNTITVDEPVSDLRFQQFSWAATIRSRFTDGSDRFYSGGIDGAPDKGLTAPPLAITSFTATPATSRPGQAVTLSWATQGAESVLIDNGVGTQPAFGSVTVSPTSNTTYTLTAMAGATTLTSSVTVTVLNTAIVNVTALPAPMLQLANSGGATTSYTVTNSGGAAASITLSQSGNFFTQSPTSFTLQPGANQTVTITGTAQPAGPYEGSSNLSIGLQIPLKLLSVAPPTGTVTADAGANRVDVASAAATNPSGSVTFTNHGNATLTGVLSSDVPWIIPQSGIITILPGQTVTLTFTIDRTKRPDASALIGSVEGSLLLSFLSGSGSSLAAQWGAAALGGVKPSDTTSTIPSVSLVKIVDTVQPTVSIAGVPAIGTGEVALFVAGVGHITGTKGTLFVSDVSLLNPQGSKSIDDVKFYYTPTTGNASAAKSASLPSVPGQVSVAVADVVKNVFNGNEEQGTLHIRSKDADKLAVAATVLSTNNAAGTFGNTIPVLRSDRSTGAGEALVLSGLRKDATTHTNLYIQETAGSAATVQIDFLAADGSTVSSRPEMIDAFKVLPRFDVVPANAVTAIITNTSTAGGRIAAYATPVDEASSDTWAVADWSQQLDYTPTEAVIIPVAGSVHGANNTFYRTDVAITNRASSAASGTLRYVSRTGDKIDRQISLGAKQSEVISDVVGSRFNVAGDTVGYLVFTPVAGSFAITSRTFTTVGGKPDTFGTGVPALAAASALQAGGSRPIAGLADAARSTVVAGRPGTFRTNFALAETTGKPVTVRVTFRFTFPAGQKAQGVGSAFRDYALNGNQFLLLNSIAGEILGPARLQFGDLTNVEADFGVISGDGAVVLFTSSIDNATGDSILRTE